MRPHTQPDGCVCGRFVYMFLCMYEVCVKKINEIKQNNKQKVQR